MNTICLSLATNNPDNGMSTGYVSWITFEYGIDSIIDLSAVDCKKICVCRIEILKGYKKRYFLKLSRRRFPIIRYQDWFGNWCCIGIWVTLDIANKILEYLVRTMHDKICLEGGWTEACDAWDAKKSLDFGTLTGLSHEN